MCKADLHGVEVRNGVMQSVVECVGVGDWKKGDGVRDC